ncbi:MAG: hypothetical protein Q9218_003724 [Villophora microphyllina]
MSDPQSRPSVPLTTRVIPSPSLATYTDLTNLVSLINRSFAHAHVHGASYEIWPTGAASSLRLWNPEQLAGELGPEGFCIVAYAAVGENATDGAAKLVATASAKPYDAQKASEGATGEVNLMFKRPAVSETKEARQALLAEDLPTWELLAMVVDPELQKRGLSTQLLDLTLEEIKRRVAAETWNDEKGTRILVSTMKELSEGYYLKKGWTTTEERRFPPGTAGSTNAFSVVDMVRII